MTKTKDEISPVKIMTAIRELDDKVDPADADISSFIGEVHSMISEFRDRFHAAKTEATTEEQCHEASDMIIDMAHSAIVTSIGSFDLPDAQLKRMKNQFCRTMTSNSDFMNETFAWSFTIQFWNNHLKSKSRKKSSNN